MKIKMMSGDIFNITEQEVKNIKEKSGLVFVPSLNGFINLSSVESILSEELIKYAKNEGYLSDGTRVIKKFGAWVLANSPEIVVDAHYYPEVAKDEVLLNKPNIDIKSNILPEAKKSHLQQF